jgi:hypothetical protein
MSIKEFDVEKLELFIKSKNIKNFPGIFRWGKRNAPQGYHYWYRFWSIYSSPLKAINRRTPIEQTSEYKYLLKLLESTKSSTIEWE